MSVSRLGVDMQALEGLVGWQLRSYTGRPDFDDLAQEVRIAAWRAASASDGRHASTTLMVNAVRWTIADYMRGRGNPLRQHTRSGIADLELVPLPEEDGDEWLANWSAEGDFAPAAVERLTAAALWERCKGVLRPREARALYLCWGIELSRAEAAAQLGMSLSGLDALMARAVTHCRQRVRQEEESSEDTAVDAGGGYRRAVAQQAAVDRGRNAGMDAEKESVARQGGRDRGAIAARLVGGAGADHLYGAARAGVG